MAIVSLRIPQIGEGLQEARLVSKLKNPGDRVARDEPIYQMETDKAVMDVESPHEGVLVEWLGEVDEVLAIGAEVARMEVAGEVEDAPPAHHAPASAPSAEPAARTHEPSARRTDIPPRTRAYAKEKGLSDEQIASLPSTGAKLMPEDVDAFLAGASSQAYEEQPMPAKQRVLASRLVRGSQLVVPGTMSLPIHWKPIEDLRAEIKASGDAFQPSAFTMFAFAVARALREHPAFRTSVVGESTLRTYKEANLGIAVALPGDELVLAVIEDSTKLGWREFAERARARIEEARGGKDQANESVTLSLTNMQSYGLREAVPVVVPPSVGTLFLGEPYFAQDPASPEPGIVRLANLGLTFDHRAINGVGAAEFLAAIKRCVESIRELVAQ